MLSTLINVTKKCSKCGRIKPLRAFYKRHHGGRESTCKLCRIARTREVQKENPEFLRAARKRWCKRNALKLAAGRMLNAAVKRGEIIKPTACEQCGRDKVRLEAHHTDYAKPLQVTWMCPKCHRFAGHGKGD